MSVAWEWRAFRPANAPESLPDLIKGLQPETSQVSASVYHEEDLYLVIPGCPHNLKLRSGALEAKWRVEFRPGGYSLWADKEVWPFPLGPGPLGALAAIARRRCVVDRPIESPTDLIDWLRTIIPGVAVVPLVKQRARYVLGGARLEAAHLRLPGNGQWYSVCVDGYDLRSVKDLVRRGRLLQWGRSMSYIDLLHEAAWWLAAAGHCDLAMAEESPWHFLTNLV